ncbi:MAG: ABC transporter permease [Pseudomonadota bacterium]
MNGLGAYWQGLIVGYYDFRNFWSLRSWLFGWMLRILSNSFAWVLMGRMLGSPEKQSYLLVGNAVAVGATSALWASNASGWSRFDGTHPLMVIAPASLVPATIGRTSIWLFNGIATSVASFSVLMLAFGYRPTLSQALLVLPLLVLVCISSYCFALFLGAMVGRRIRLRNLVLDVTGTLFMAWCGVSVPVSFWPGWIQFLVQMLPLSHGLTAIRGVLTDAPLRLVLRESVLETSVGAAWLAISLLLIDRVAESGRRDGSIELV